MKDLNTNKERRTNNKAKSVDLDDLPYDKWFAQLLKLYSDKKSRQVEFARIMFQLSFNDFSYRQQLRVRNVFFDGCRADRIVACRMLEFSWNKRFLPKVLSLWHEHHERCTGRLVVKFAPLHVVETESHDLSKVVTYYDLAMRLAKNKKNIIDGSRMKTIDYFDFLIVNHRPITDADFDGLLKFYAGRSLNFIDSLYDFVELYSMLTDRKKLRFMLWIEDEYMTDKSVEAFCKELVSRCHHLRNRREIPREYHVDVRSKSKFIDAVFDKFRERFLFLVGRLTVDDISRRYGNCDDFKTEVAEKSPRNSLNGSKRTDIDCALCQSNCEMSRLIDNFGLEVEGLAETPSDSNKEESVFDPYFYGVPGNLPPF
jgi:hypothetical protein